MNSIGVDLHKQIITVCVVNDEFQVVARKTLYGNTPDTIVTFFEQFQPFHVVVEATASYHWFVEFVDPLASKVVLANPNKLRIIAESTRKTDRLDAQILAEFLALDMIPQAYLPTPRQRQHRALVRHRQHLQGETTAVKNKIRRILSDYNADRRDLFSLANQEEFITQVQLNDADRFVIEQLWANLRHFSEPLSTLTKKLKEFAKKAPHREKEAREVLKTVPGVGPVTIDKQGSGLLRWALVEAAWRIIRTSKRGAGVYERIAQRAKGKRAIVAIARKLLCVISAMFRTMTPYRVLTT
jgi:transposase